MLNYLKTLFKTIILFSVSCSFAQNIGTQAKIKQLLQKHPDSALPIIRNTLALPKLHDTVYGTTYNLYAIYHGMTGQPDSVIYYTKKSISYLEKHPEIKVRSIMNLSLGYRNKGDFKTAINYLEKAQSMYTQQKNNTGLAIAYGELASNYNYMLKYDISVKYLLKSIKIFKAEKDTMHLAVVQQKLANTYLAKNNFEFAIDLYKDCLANFKKFGMHKNYYLTLINLGDAQIHIKDYKGAEQSLNEAAAGLLEFGDRDLIGVCLSKLGSVDVVNKNYLAAKKHYQQAFENAVASGSIRCLRIGAEYIDVLNYTHTYNDALEIAGRITTEIYTKANIEDKMYYNNVIAKTYKATGNSSKAINAYEKTILYKDSIANNKNQDVTNSNQAKFQTALQREKNKNLLAGNIALKKQMDTEKHIMFLYIAISIALFIVILLLLRGYWLKSKLQMQELKSIETDKFIFEQKHLHDREINNKQKEIIDEKQRELTSSALIMSNFQDNIQHIIDKCNNDGYKNLVAVKKELQQLTKQNDYWKQFENRFNNLHPDFGATLNKKFENLTKNDIEFCSLLKLKLSNKEIAALLQISHESVITKKYRIKKKMGIQDDEDFDTIIFSTGY